MDSGLSSRAIINSSTSVSVQVQQGHITATWQQLQPACTSLSAGVRFHTHTQHSLSCSLIQEPHFLPEEGDSSTIIGFLLLFFLSLFFLSQAIIHEASGRHTQEERNMRRWMRRQESMGRRRPAAKAAKCVCMQHCIRSMCVS